MILAIWFKSSLKVLESKDISDSYTRYEDEGYRQKVVQTKLNSMGFKLQDMEYGLFNSEEDLKGHMKNLLDDRIKAFKEIQDRIKGITQAD